MALTIQDILTEANTLVPNSVQTADQVLWLNGLNADFFNAVKIAKITRFTAVKGQADYPLAIDVRMKDIDLVEVGLLRYLSLQTDGVNPTQNVFSFDDETARLTISPAAYQDGVAGIVRHRRIATTTFTTANLIVFPDVPDEYQWTLIPGLAAFLANTQDDAVKAGNYEQQYKAGWNLAAQNYNVRTVGA